MRIQRVRLTCWVVKMRTLSPVGDRGKKVGACCIEGKIFFLRKSKKNPTVKGEATNENT